MVMQSNRIYGSFVLVFAVIYILFITSLPFPQQYKYILYIPSLFMFALFLFLAMGRRSDEEEATDSYFNF